MEIVRFKEAKNLDGLLINYTRIYAIDSMYRGIKYGISDDKFAVISPHGIVADYLTNIEEFSGYFRKHIEREILEIWEDIKDIDMSYWRTQ